MRHDDDRRPCPYGAHDLVVFARQHPWFGYWDVSVECFDCGSGYRAPTRCWRRARLDVVVGALLRHLDFEDAQ